MKRILSVSRGHEKGQVMILALILLVIGGLIIAPLLSYMGSGLKVGQTYEKNMNEFYAADAGIELGMWKLLNGETVVPAYELNDADVEVTIIGPVTPTATQMETFSLSEADTVYQITAIATTIGSDSSTTVESYVVKITEYDEGSFTSYGGDGNIEGGNVIVEDGDTVYGNILGNANVYGEGDFALTGNIEGDAIVCVEGDLDVSFGNITGNAIVYIFGNLTLHGNIQGNAKVYVAGNLTMNGSIQDTTIVCVGGDLTLDGSVEVDVYVGGIIDYGGSMYAANLGFDNCPLCGECPFAEQVFKILTLETQ